MAKTWVEYVVIVLTGLATAIPLISKLVEYVKTSTKEKNWSSLVSFVIQLMEVAEEKFENGATKKEWVLNTIQKLSGLMNYNIDIDVIGNLIDTMCDMSKVLNVLKKKDGDV